MAENRLGEGTDWQTSRRMKSRDRWGQQGASVSPRTQRSSAAAHPENCIFFPPTKANYKTPLFWGKKDPDPQLTTNRHADLPAKDLF